MKLFVEDGWFGLGMTTNGDSLSYEEALKFLLEHSADLPNIPNYISFVVETMQKRQVL